MSTTTTGMDLSTIDLTDAGVWQRGAPHEWLDAIRTQDPVFWHEESDGEGFWTIPRHEDVRYVSSNPLLFSNWIGGPMRLTPEGGADAVRLVIIGMDPPEHRMFRSIVSRAFTPRMIAELESSLRRETKRVIDDLRGRTRCDFVPDVAARVPMWSISELMGVPLEDRHLMYELSHALIDDQDKEVAPSEEAKQADSARLFGYAMEMAAKERANPGNNLTSALLAAEVDGRALTDMEYSMFFMFLIVAGNETTRTATSHGLLTLMDHPDVLARLQADPSLIPGAVEELLRWEPPIHHFRRTASEDTVLGGKQIKKNDKVLMWYAASNRDPEVFDRPHELDIDRSPNMHQSFGIGQHFCLGANLARLSLRIMFEELLANVTDFELAEPPRPLYSNVINGIKEMQLNYRMID